MNDDQDLPSLISSSLPQSVTKLTAEELIAAARLYKQLGENRQQSHDHKMDWATFSGTCAIICMCLGASLVLALNGKETASAAFLGAPIVVSLIGFAQRLSQSRRDQTNKPELIKTD